MKYDLQKHIFLPKTVMSLAVLLEFSVHIMLHSMKKMHQAIQQ